MSFDKNQQLVRFEYQQKASSESLNTLSYALSTTASSLVNDIIGDGCISTLDFQITIGVGTIDVGGGVGYAQGLRVFVPSESVAYDRNRLSLTPPTGPLSTGNVGIPITVGADNYVWVGHIYKYDINSSSDPIYNSLSRAYYAYEDGYDILITSTDVSPGPTYVRIGLVNAAGSVDYTVRQLVTIRTAPGGSNKEIQYNDSGVFAGATNFKYSLLDGGIVQLSSTNTNAVFSVGYIGGLQHGILVDVGTGNRVAASVTNNTSSASYPTLSVTNSNASGLAALFTGILSTDKLRLSTTPTSGGLMYSSNASGDSAWAASLTWDNSTTTLSVPTLTVSAGLSLTGGAYMTGRWQTPVIDWDTFSTTIDGLIAFVTGIPGLGNQLAIKLGGTAYTFNLTEVV